MKKLIAILLVLSLLVCFAACDNKPAESSETPAGESTPADESKPADESTPAAESSEEPAPAESSEEPAPAESSEEPAPAESSEEPAPAESSEEPEVSDDEPTLEVAPFLNYMSSQYVSWQNTPATKSLAHGGIVDVRKNQATSVQLTAVNGEVAANVASLIAYNSDYGAKLSNKKGEYASYAIYTFDYNHDTFHYELTEKLEPGKAKSSVEIPADGFLLAVHEYFADQIAAIDKAAEGASFYPHGFRGTNDIDATIKSKSGIKIDGDVSKEEYGTAVWEIVPDETYVSYEQFPENEYYATAKVYMSYDKDNLYLGVVVTSPSHYNTCTMADAGSMWQYECIQVNVTSVSPMGEFITEHWDNVVDGTAVSKNIVRQYGFAVNDSDETIYCVWMGTPNTFTGETVCTRDDDNQITTYEVAIPWSEIGSGDDKITGTKGEDLGVSVSVNSGTASKTFMNIYLRDGGGIIGLNDWSKVPVITLG